MFQSHPLLFLLWLSAVPWLLFPTAAPLLTVVVEITASSATSVAGTVAFAFTDDESGLRYALDGSFEVLNCGE
jgi:hypothetical protein